MPGFVGAASGRVSRERSGRRRGTGDKAADRAQQRPERRHLRERRQAIHLRFAELLERGVFGSIEPQLVAWSKKLPPDVVLRRIPVAFRDDFVPQQRLYYTLEAMGKVDELHDKVFQAIHVQRQPTDREDRILAFAEKNGLDKAKFQELYNSFGVQTKTRQAKQLQDDYQVDGVPALGIAGRYYTDGTMANGMDHALQVVDYLVAESRKSK